MAGFFGFFDYTKPGKGVSKEDVDKSGIALYFDILGRRIWKYATLNLIYVAASIPAFVIGWAVVSYLILLLQSITGIVLEAAELGVVQIFAAAVLVLFCGSGSASTAMSYVLRKFVNDTHSWVWSDFWDSFKSNFVQGTIAYFINIIVFSLCCIGIMFYAFAMSGLMSVFLSTVVLIVLAVFMMMQMYVYQIMSGFELKIKDIYRNAFLLTLGKLPWNILCGAVTVLFAYGLSYLVVTPLSIIVLAVIFYSFVAYTQIFMTNNVVKKYLQKPAEEKESQDSEE